MSEMTPADVPDELVRAALKAYCVHCSLTVGRQPWSDHEEEARVILAAALLLHAQQLREQLAAETAIARDLLQRNVELGTRADSAEAAGEDLREQLAAANDTTPSTAAAWEVDAYATRYTAYSTGAADDAPGWPPVDAMHTVVAELAAANERAQMAERERDDARIETAHANERARLDGAMANAWVEHCDTLDVIDRDPGRTGCEPGCDSPHHEQLRQALAEITRLTNQVDAAKVLRNATESMYGVFKKIAATRRTDRDQARAETAELRARLDGLGEERVLMYRIIGAIEHAYALNTYVELEPGETAPTVESLWAEVRELRGVTPDAAADGHSATQTGGDRHGETTTTPDGTGTGTTHA